MLGEVVTLSELDVVGSIVHLCDDVASTLADTGLVVVRPEGGGRWRLLPNGRVGAVRVAGLQIVVEPKDKVRLDHLLFLLGYATDPGFRPEFVAGRRYDELWPALGYALAMSIERTLEHGLLQGYVTRDEALRIVRGRIRFADQLTVRPGQLIPIEVTHDEYSVDIAENQILLAAIRRILAVPRLDVNVRRRLQHLAGRLAEVSVIIPGRPIPRWSPTRLNIRYHSALRLCDVVLQNSSVKASAGGVECASFVVTMWKVFEDFVTVALMESLRSEPGRPRRQLAAYLAGSGDWRTGSIPMNVDIVHTDSRGNPRVVFDAKYKASTADDRYANADHYQMLAYCTALQVPRAWLVYAAGPGSSRVRRVKNTSVEIVEYPLDLAQPPRQILEQIRTLVEESITNRS